MVRPFIFRCTDYLGHTRHVGAVPFRAAAFFRGTDPAGCTNRVSVFVPNGRGFFAEIQRGGCALRSAGIRGARRGGKAEGQPAVFLPL